MALADFRITRWVSGRLPDFRVSLTAYDPAADFTYEEVSSGALPDYIVQVVAADAVPRPDFKLALDKGGGGYALRLSGQPITLNSQPITLTPVSANA